MKILSKDLFTSIVGSKTMLVTFAVNVIEPEGATVKLTSAGYVQEGNYIRVPIGAKIDWSVEKLGYESEKGSFVAVGDSSVSVRLTDLPMCTISVVTTPTDAYASISSADGVWRNQQGLKSLRVPVGTDVNITVSDPELNAYTTSLFAQEDKQIDVILTNTITIAPDPEDADVKINGVPGTTKTQLCNAVVDWVVEKEGYVSQSETIPLNERGVVPNRIMNEQGDNRIKVTLEKQTYAVEFVANYPSDVKITAQVETGPSESDYGSLVVYGHFGDVIKWTAEKEGYVTKTGEFVIDGKSTPEAIQLELKKYLITINPEPSTCVVTIKSGDSVLKTGNGSQFVNVETGTELGYTVQSGSVIKTGSLIVSGDQSIDVELAVGSIKVDVYSLNISDLGGSDVCYPVFANAQTVTLSGNRGNIVMFDTTSGSLQKKSEQELGYVKNWSTFDSAPERMVYFAGYHGISAKEDTAMQVSIDPNREIVTIDDTRVFGSAIWGFDNFIKTDNGWLGIHFGKTLDVYLDTEKKYSYTAYSGNISGYVQQPRLQKINASSALARKVTDIALYTQGDVVVKYYDMNIIDTLPDYNGFIACAGYYGFGIFDSSYNRIYVYASPAGSTLRLLGRISDYYYVLGYPNSSTSSDKKTYLYVFHADGSGLKEKIEVSAPGWTTSTKTAELPRIIPHVSQTGYLLAVGASGTFGTYNPFVIRVQGY